MKSISTKIYILIGLIVLLVVVSAVLSQKKQTRTSEQQTSSATSGTVAPAPTPKKTVAPTGVYKQTNSYSDYQNSQIQLSTNQNNCKSASVSQYNQLYSGKLEGSSFEDHYNPTSNLCYMKVTGISHPAYSSTATKVVYFRNITKSTLLAECLGPNNEVTFADDQWKCTDKTTGQSISFTQFNALIYKSVSP